MAFGKSADGSGTDSGFAEQVKKIVDANLIRKTAFCAAQTHICGGAAMPDYTGMDAVPACHQGGPGGKAGGVGGVIIVENDAFFCNTIYTRGGIPLITVTTQMVGAQGIHIYE